MNIMFPRIIFLLFPSVLSMCEYPTMSMGHFNITSEKQFKDILKKESVFLLGLTSVVNCEDCCEQEVLYKALVDTIEMYTPRIPFMRVDYNKAPFIKNYITADGFLPQVYGIRKGSIFRYYDLNDVMKMLKFADRLIAPVSLLSSETEVVDFLKLPKGQFDSLKLLALVSEEDLLKDFEKVALTMPNWFSTEFRAVTDKSLIKSLKGKRDEVRYLNSLVLLREDTFKILDLEVPQDMQKWISHNCVPLLTEITPYNFHMYTSSGRPVVFVFLDPNNVHHFEYLSLVSKTALKFDEKLKFAWVNATSPDIIYQKKNVGLITEILPAVAFNSKNIANYPFPEGKEINEKNLDVFVQGFYEKEKEVYASEWIPQTIELEHCEKLNSENFEDFVFQEGFDSLVFVYSSHNSVESEKASILVNRICEKVKELEIDSIGVYAFDAAKNRVNKNVRTLKFPTIFLAPAKKKENDLRYYTGKNNFQEILKFVDNNSHYKLNLVEKFEKNTKQEL